MRGRRVRRPLRQLALRAAAALAGAAALIAPASAHAAVPSIRFGQAVSLKLPSNAGPGRSGFLGASCVATGACTLAGFYTDASSVEQAMVITESGGHWARAAELQLPSDATAGLGGAAEAVSCTRPGSCVAAGGYEVNGHFRGFTATESHGTWRRAIGVKLPSNAMSPGDASIGGIACTGPGNCVVVGSYLDNQGHTQGMAVTERNGKWGRGRELAPPASAGLAGGIFVTSVACPKAGSCAAVGLFHDKALHARAMTLAESNGSWHQATPLRLPKDAAAVPLVSVASVACSGVGSCVAVGQYRDRLGRFVAMSAGQSGGTWARAQRVTRAPAGAAAPSSLFLGSAACERGGPCLAAGDYVLAKGGMGATVLTRSGTRWTSAVQIRTPPDGAIGKHQNALLSALGCSAAGFCVVAGQYRTSSLTFRNMAATG